MGFEFEVDGVKFAATPENSSVQIIMPQHLLDHILLVDWVEIDDVWQPQGKRVFRELFDNNGYSFNEIAAELSSLAVPFIYHQEIPEVYEDCYVQSAIGPLDAEWEFWDKELH